MLEVGAFLSSRVDLDLGVLDEVMYVGLSRIRRGDAYQCQDSSGRESTEDRLIKDMCP